MPQGSCFQAHTPRDFARLVLVGTYYAYALVVTLTLRPYKDKGYPRTECHETPEQEHRPLKDFPQGINHHCHALQ